MLCQAVIGNVQRAPLFLSSQPRSVFIVASATEAPLGVSQFPQNPFEIVEQFHVVRCYNLSQKDARIIWTFRACEKMRVVLEVKADIIQHRGSRWPQNVLSSHI